MWTVDRISTQPGSYTVLACLEGKATLYVIVEMHASLPQIPELQRVEATTPSGTALAFRKMSIEHNKRCDDTFIMAAFELPADPPESFDVTLQIQGVPPLSTRFIRT